MKQVKGIRRVTLDYAIDQFLRHCRLKNLSKTTLTYYEEDVRYFQRTTEVTYLDEIDDKLYEDFILYEMDKGNRMTSVNCRTRGLRVFLRFCAKREYMEAVTIPMMKVDETFKDPYTDDELQKLLKRPTDESFVEWRCWAAVNTFLATGKHCAILTTFKREQQPRLHRGAVKHRKKVLNMKNTKFLKFFQVFLTNCLCQMGLFNAAVYLTDCAAHRPFHFDLLVGLVVPIVCGVISAMMVVGGIGRKRNQLEGR